MGKVSRISVSLDYRLVSFNPIITLVFTFSSGQGPKRVNSLTHDTKKALVQTTSGQIEVCKHLLQKGFTYVLL